MHRNENTHITEPVSSKRVPPRKQHRQLPVDTGVVTEIWFTASSTQFIRVVAMNDVNEGAFEDDTEYWYTSGNLALSGISTLTMASQADTFDEEDIEDFIGQFSLAFEHEQSIGTGGWTEGTRSPTGAQARLYKATDPDNVNRQIGLLIEMNSNDDLTAITWYKRENTGTIFASTPSTLSFTLVTDGMDNPSVDPTDIANETWYYVTMSV